jgi:CubicO group peptidase (beta-lactamase class C family)
VSARRGRRSTERSLTQDAIFRIASMTKPITSVALMQFLQPGRIGLDDPASKHLPELKAAYRPYDGYFTVQP